ncbi:thiamine pyrophosphate-binding protein [Haladaptatus sp. DJG-WS-42]|uniref:thiamine pyrophosphate-binding protein n=1 Tax=Haladaptatus sp. DJG-WS-42 TaxID=3120516 RepID=UPI0030CEE817
MATGGDAVARVLAENGVTHVFTLLGNQTVSIAQGLTTRGVAVITARHEYNAAVMADTYGRLTGDPGVVLTVAGPGGTNALTGIAQAYAAMSPVLCISAVLPETAPPESLHGVDDPHLLAHVFDDATKWSTQVHDATRLPETLNRAFDVATSGRPGPVFVGIDEEILMGEVELPESRFAWTHHDDAPVAPDTVVTALNALRGRNRRVLYVGKGVSRAFAGDIVVDIAEALDCPVVCPRHYPDSFPNDHRLYAGSVGMADHPAASVALRTAETVLSLGVRVDSHEAAVLDDRTPDEAELVFFATGPREPTRIPAFAVVSGDLHTTLRVARDELQRDPGETATEYRENVLAEAERVRDAIADYYEAVREQVPIHPLFVLQTLRAVADDDVIVTGDAGAAGGAWPNDAFEFRAVNSFQHSRLYDSMGFPVPAGNAAKLVFPDRQVVNLVGDGGMLMCVMELATAVETDTNAVTVVLNDAKYGMIWNYQRSRGYEEVGTTNPPIDFAAIARGFGVNGVRVETPEAFRPALEDALTADRHTVLDVVIDPEAAYVSRKVW